MRTKGWYGVDLDGTLARYDGWVSSTHIGPPIEPMVKRVKQWLVEGKDVRIFTARVGYKLSRNGFSSPFPNVTTERKAIVKAIQDWCLLYIGKKLPVTCEKDYDLIVFYDDHCVQVESNTGKILGRE